MRTLKRKVSRLINCLPSGYVVARKRDIAINGLALGIACRLLETYSDLRFEYWAAKLADEASAEINSMNPQQVDALLEKCEAARKRASKSNFFAVRGW